MVDVVELVQIDAAAFLETLLDLARQYPDLPVAIIFDGKTYQIGVLDIPDVMLGDWHEYPVSLDEFVK